MAEDDFSVGSFLLSDLNPHRQEKQLFGPNEEYHVGVRSLILAAIRLTTFVAARPALPLQAKIGGLKTLCSKFTTRC